MSAPQPDPAPPAGPNPAGRRRARQLRVVASVIVWALLFWLALRLVNALDFGEPGMPRTLVVRFVVETLLFTVLAHVAIRSLPFGLKPGLRATAALGLWIALIVMSDCLSRLEYGVLEAALESLRESLGLGGLVLGTLIYMLALALPFVPGVEISVMIMMLFGAVGAATVYVATVAGLALAFAAGRLIPERVLAEMLRRLGVALPEGAFDVALRALVARHGPGRPAGLWGRLMAYRYLALAVAVNLPGNSVLGGGGGIAVLCGASRQFEWYWFVLTLLVATAPIPALVIAGGLDVRDIVHLHDWAEGLFARIGSGR